ncbi:MAG: hypothetical protein WC410_00345 [Candidatus Paceibacterota bacterium]|nr:hypothetical protein [Candidatus Paceibacterota bacterium]
MSEMSEKIKEYLAELDFDPELPVKEEEISSPDVWVVVGDGYYRLDNLKNRSDDRIMELNAFELAARAVRMRAAKSRHIELFPKYCRGTENPICLLGPPSGHDDDIQADAIIFGRISMFLFLIKIEIEKIAGLVCLDAGEILKRREIYLRKIKSA